MNAKMREIGDVVIASFSFFFELYEPGLSFFSSTAYGLARGSVGLVARHRDGTACVYHKSRFFKLDGPWSHVETVNGTDGVTIMDRQKHHEGVFS